MAQRIVRGKAKNTRRGNSFRCPPASELPDRLSTVLAVTYLVLQRRLLGIFW